MAAKELYAGRAYRIQNLKFGTYLEFSEVKESGELSLAPLKSGEVRQHWEFIPSPGFNSCKILNRSTASARDGVRFYLCAGPDPEDEVDWDTYSLYVTSEYREATAWFQQFQGHSARSSLFTYDAVHPKNNRFVMAADNTQLAVSPSVNPINTVHSISDNAKWLFAPVHPVINKGTYRIRLLDGGRAIYMSNKGVSAGSQPFSSQHLWTVDPQFRQGTLTLKGVDIPQFLSLAGGSHEKLVVGSPNKAVSWYLENCGPFGSSDGYFTFSMSVRVPNVKFPLALTLNRNSNAVVLEPLQNMRSQLWFFEQTFEKQVDD